MTDDLLQRATRALRETSAEEQPRSGLTRARILASAEKRYPARRGTLLRWVVTVAAALAASTALARVAQYWPEIKRALGAESAERSDAAVQRAKRATHSARPPSPKIAPPAAVEAPAAPPAIAAPPDVQPEAAAPSVARARPAVARKHRVPVAADVPSVAVPEPAPVIELTPVPAPAPAPEAADLVLFRRAQGLHLARDPRALAAWDDYLRVSSAGALVPEARYNRALCLIRLGRKAEARTALAPFAAGEYGNYRRAEASALIDALQASK